jgi:WD domain, G-beta repeat
MRGLRSSLVLALALVALACGAASPRAASAEPRKKSAKHHAAARTAPVAITAGTAERVKKVWEAAAGGYGRAVAISARFGRVAFASKDSVDLFDLQSGKAAGSVKRCRDVVHTGMAFHGRDLVIVCEKSVVVVDALDLGAKKPPAVASSRITAATFAGSRFVLGHHDGVMRIYSLDGGATTEVHVPGPPIDVKSLALARDGSRLAVAWVQGSIWWWDTDKPAESHDLVRHESESDALSFNDDSSLLAEEGRKNTTTLWALGSPPSEKHELKNGSWIKRIVFTKDGKWLARGGSDGLELAEIAGPKRVALDTRSPVEDMALDENGATLVAGDRDGRLTVWAVR